jgi:hypothetical protein
MGKTVLPAQDLYVGAVKIFGSDGAITSALALDDGSVTAAKMAAAALAKTTAGRAVMADDYFDATTVLAKFDANSFDNAALILAIADGAFNADAATRALFDDGIWTLAKLAATAKTHILSYQVEDLAAGVDITDRVIFYVPTDIDATLVSATIISQGSAQGIADAPNTCVIKLTDGAHDIVEKTYNTGAAFPADGAEQSLGTLAVDYVKLAEGEKLYLSVTNGTLANPPAFMLQITYTLADA